MELSSGAVKNILTGTCFRYVSRQCNAILGFINS